MLNVLIDIVVKDNKEEIKLARIIIVVVGQRLNTIAYRKAAEL